MHETHEMKGWSLVVVGLLACACAPSAVDPAPAPAPTGPSEPGAPAFGASGPRPEPRCAPLPSCGAASTLTAAIPTAPDVVVDGFAEHFVHGHRTSTDSAVVLFHHDAAWRDLPVARPGSRVKAGLGAHVLVCGPGAASCEVLTTALEATSLPRPPFDDPRDLGGGCVAGDGVACLVGGAWVVALDPSKAPARVRSFQAPAGGARGLAVFDDGSAAYVEPSGALTPIALSARLAGARLQDEIEPSTSASVVRLAGVTEDGRLVVGDRERVAVCPNPEGLVGFGTLGDAFAWRADGTAFALQASGSSRCTERFESAPRVGQAVRKCGLREVRGIVASTAIGKRSEAIACD